jgi:hypothetical protein
LEDDELVFDPKILKARQTIAAEPAGTLTEDDMQEDEAVMLARS